MVVLRFEFDQNRLRGFGAVGGVEICPSPLTWPTTGHTTACTIVRAVIAILVPKLVAMASSLAMPLSLVYGSVTDEFSNSTNPISKPNSAWIRCIQLKLWPFLCH